MLDVQSGSKTGDRLFVPPPPGLIQKTERLMIFDLKRVQRNSLFVIHLSHVRLFHLLMADTQAIINTGIPW